MPVPSPRAGQEGRLVTWLRPRAECGSGFESPPTHPVDGFAPYT